jgi:hypothetical protein
VVQAIQSCEYNLMENIPNKLLKANVDLSLIDMPMNLTLEKMYLVNGTYNILQDEYKDCFDFLQRKPQHIHLLRWLAIEVDMHYLFTRYYITDVDVAIKFGSIECLKIILSRYNKNIPLDKYLCLAISNGYEECATLYN